MRVRLPLPVLTLRRASRYGFNAVRRLVAFLEVDRFVVLAVQSELDRLAFTRGNVGAVEIVGLQDFDALGRCETPEVDSRSDLVYRVVNH